MSSKEDKDAKSIDWKSFTPEQYQETIEELVHFSVKTTNSNAPKGGVRLAADESLQLPYVSARTLMAADQQIPMDYTANAGKTATIIKQAKLVLSGEAVHASDDEQKTVQAAIASTIKSHQEIGLDFVSPRLRQLLLPKDNGYVSVTPLTAGGTCQLINEKVKAHDEAVKLEREKIKQAKKEAKKDLPKPKLTRITTAVFGLGGANPQNVGSLVRKMQRPMVFFSPTGDTAPKQVLSLFHNGCRIVLPKKLLFKLRLWLTQEKNSDNQLPTKQAIQDQFKDFIIQFVQAILLQGKQAYHQLITNQHLLPKTSTEKNLVSSEAPLVEQGLIDSRLRDSEWKLQLTEQLATTITEFNFHDQEGGLGLNDHDKALIKKWIEEVL